MMFLYRHQLMKNRDQSRTGYTPHKYNCILFRFGLSLSMYTNRKPKYISKVMYVAKAIMGDEICFAFIRWTKLWIM